MVFMTRLHAAVDLGESDRQLGSSADHGMGVSSFGVGNSRPNVPI